MARFHVCFIVAFLLTFGSLGGTAHGEDIATFPLDAPETGSLEIATDTQTKAEGAASLRITTPRAVTIPVAEIDAPGVDNARLTYSARVKTALEGEGQAYLEMWCIFKDGQYFSRGLDNPATGATDWSRLSTPFFLKSGQMPEKITLNLVIQGSGTVWIDDVHLSAGPLN